MTASAAHAHRPMCSAMPWQPRQCAHCGACECETGAVYELAGKPAKARVLVCRECLDRARRGLGL